MGRIVLEHVSKEFPGGVQAVRDVSLEIENGEFMVLVGPSGCGKTTILRMIAGLDEVTDGEITIGDRVVTDEKPKDRDIAMVFQNYALYPHMTVEQNIGFGMRLRRTPKPMIKQRVSGAAQVLALLDYLARKPSDLSGGQRQRVAIGRAMVREPQAFLMDEPLSNLDAKLRVQMRAELARLHKQLGTTIVYVTHDQVEAMTLGHPGGGGLRRGAAAGRHARRCCSTTRSTCSSPGSSARRRSTWSRPPSPATSWSSAATACPSRPGRTSTPTTDAR